MIDSNVTVIGRRVFVLDFDGVILDSANLKMDAFIAMFDGDDEAIAYLRANPGRSRFEKFRHIIQELRGETYSEGLENELSNAFVTRVEAVLAEAPWIPGSLEFLQEIHGRASVYIVSATPEAELGSMIHDRGITSYVEGWFGAPIAKSTALAFIAAQSGVALSEMTFIGDALSDAQSAVEAGVPFAAFAHDGDFGLFGADVDHRITDLRQLFSAI